MTCLWRQGNSRLGAWNCLGVRVLKICRFISLLIMKKFSRRVRYPINKQEKNTECALYFPSRRGTAARRQSASLSPWRDEMIHVVQHFKKVASTKRWNISLRLLTIIVFMIWKYVISHFKGKLLCVGYYTALIAFFIVKKYVRLYRLLRCD